MRLKKGDEVIELTEQAHIDAYIKAGYVEVEEVKAKPKKENK